MKTDNRAVMMIGKRYGRLTVMAGPCGRTKEINGSNLRLGKTLSCGCIQRERASLSTQGWLPAGILNVP
jgi:hypothetical protein